jgi:hypothetical protein
MKLTTHPHLLLKLRCLEVYLNFPISFMACLTKDWDNFTFLYSYWLKTPSSVNISVIKNINNSVYVTVWSVATVLNVIVNCGDP